MVIALGMMVSCAAIVGILFGPNAATQTLALTTALAGAVAAFEKVFPSPPATQVQTMPAPSAKHRRMVAAVLFAAGALAGYGSPRIAAVLFPPTASVRVSAAEEVDMKDRATLTWRNVPQQYEVWLLVYHDGIYYPQEYRVRSNPNGKVVLDITVGRQGDGGKTFELVPVLAAPEAQKDLQDHILDGLGGIPVGAVRFRGVVVRRKM